MELASVAKYKAPRVVQARDVTWLREVGKYSRPVEKAILHRDRVRGWFNFAKGYTQRELGRILASKLSKFPCPRIICLDHSAFDGHVTLEHSGVFWGLIKRAYPKQHREWIAFLQRGTENNRARAGPIRFKWKGTVASGDITTSFEDCIINYCVLRSALHVQGVKNFELLINGDDSIIIIDQSEVFSTSAALRHLRQLNMETKVEYDGNDPNRLIFCQLQLRDIGGGEPMMVHQVDRLTKRYGMTHRCRQFTVDEYQHALAYCYWTLYKGTPYGGAFERLHQRYCPGRCEDKIAVALRKDPDLAFMLRPLFEREGRDIRCPGLDLCPTLTLPEWRKCELRPYEVDHLRHSVLGTTLNCHPDAPR